jgi:hypothetical protein
MRPYEFDSFDAAIQQAKHQFHYRSRLVHSDRWQGAEIKSRPEMATHELTHISFGVPLDGEDLQHYRDDIKPNLPWADNHFDERVCGAPINPGIEWENWPYGKSASTFLENGKFNHNYMERYWPRHARAGDPPSRTVEEWVKYNRDTWQNDTGTHNHGVRYHYGDLKDVVQLLSSDPYTRQAYLPVWFPEDTGGGAKRAPCTIGYHFLMRGGLLDVNYEIRSCDFVRHFRDDCYLTIRLLLWVLDRCRDIDVRWADVKPGKFFIQIGSFHIFRNDYTMLFGSDR